MGVIEIISLIVAVVGGMAVWALTGGQVQFWRGKRAGKKKADDKAARDYNEKRRELDNADLGHGATDFERIKRLRGVAKRGSGGDD